MSDDRLISLQPWHLINPDRKATNAVSYAIPDHDQSLERPRRLESLMAQPGSMTKVAIDILHSRGEIETFLHKAVQGIDAHQVHD